MSRRPDNLTEFHSCVTLNSPDGLVNMTTNQYKQKNSDLEAKSQVCLKGAIRASHTNNRRRTLKHLSDARRWVNQHIKSLVCMDLTSLKDHRSRQLRKRVAELTGKDMSRVAIHEAFNKVLDY